MLASSKHKYSKTLAFPDTYYELIINVLQSVELFCAYIIATKYAHGSSIELSLQMLKETPTISVSDSGIPFEIDTYMKFGISEASTHTNEGGTGIGLLDTWTFKKKYHVSLIIEELDNNIYSKRLSFLFDGKNRYLIISSRYQQIRSYQTRSDLLVISSSENNATYLALSR